MSRPPLLLLADLQCTHPCVCTIHHPPLSSCLQLHMANNLRDEQSAHITGMVERIRHLGEAEAALKAQVAEMGESAERASRELSEQAAAAEQRCAVLQQELAAEQAARAALAAEQAELERSIGEAQRELAAKEETIAALEAAAAQIKVEMDAKVGFGGGAHELWWVVQKWCCGCEKRRGFGGLKRPGW